MTKEWIRGILKGDKKLCPLTDLKPVNVGNFPEVSVKALFNDFSKRPILKMYFPDKVP